MAEEEPRRQARRALLFQDDEVEAVAQTEFDEIEASALEVPDDDVQILADVLSPAPGEEYLDATGNSVEKTLEEEAEEDLVVEAAPRRPKAMKGLNFWSPSPMRGKAIPQTPVSPDQLDESSINEITEDQSFDVETPGRRFVTVSRRGNPKATSNFRFEVYQDSPRSLDLNRPVPLPRGSMSVTACLQTSIKVHQNLSLNRGAELRTKAVLSFSNVKLSTNGDFVVCNAIKVSSENELLAQSIRGSILSDGRFFGHVWIPKKYFVDSRSMGSAAIKSTFLKKARDVSSSEEEDTRFVHILPLDGEVKPGFVYISVDWFEQIPQKRVAPQVNTFPIFSVGFSIRYLCYFITHINLAQKIPVEIAPGVTITFVLEGVITKGFKVLRFGRDLSSRIQESYDKTLILTLTRVTILYPMDWYQSFPNVNSRVSRVRRQPLAVLWERGIPRPQFSSPGSPWTPPSGDEGYIQHAYDLGSRDQLVGKCDMCRREGVRLFQCKRCKDAKYCGEECAATAWQWGHKLTCKSKK